MSFLQSGHLPFLPPFLSSLPAGLPPLAKGLGFFPATVYLLAFCTSLVECAGVIGYAEIILKRCYQLNENLSQPHQQYSCSIFHLCTPYVRRSHILRESWRLPGTDGFRGNVTPRHQPFRIAIGIRNPRPLSPTRYFQFTTHEAWLYRGRR
jgi:hypothetical protein